MDDAEQPEPADRVRLVVREWSDAQLRRAWATSRHTLAGGEPLAAAQAAAVREVLLSEWERRHPAERTEWGIGELD